MGERNNIPGYIIIGVFIGILVLLIATPTGVKIYNDYKASMQKADDESDYETLKRVEATCRAMISSYEADKLTYEQYKDSRNEEKQSWAEQAKMRANKTAVSYNNYILKNSFVWKSNVPDDIHLELQIIQ